MNPFPSGWKSLPEDLAWKAIGLTFWPLVFILAYFDGRTFGIPFTQGVKEYGKSWIKEFFLK